MKEGEAENRNGGFANTDSTTITTGGGRGSFCFVERSSDLDSDLKKYGHSLVLRTEIFKRYVK